MAGTSIAKAKLPTKFGVFTACAFCIDGKRGHFVLVKGKVKGKTRVLTRLHSKCLTGDVFFSKRCDCREQLEKAIRLINKQGAGLVIYLNQEGRGIGLFNKIKAYALQENGFDTFQANVQLGFRPDERGYADAARIIKALGIRSIRILTNNPDKPEGLRKNGISITQIIPLKTRPNKFNRKYLQSKKRKGHKL
ncbi:TPA: GTP cyclohydrolase II [Candidatus Micrarchaeota archaeon]|nr:GTP cyclohydrolase II [Candidatus Micrarchaeota archaeon]